MIHEEILADPREPLRRAPAEFPGFSETRTSGNQSQALVLRAATLVGRRGCRIHCGITVISAQGIPETIAATDDIPIRADRLQHELGHGPCLQPAAVEDFVLSEDLDQEDRWPDFGVMSVSLLGIRSLLVVRIPMVGDQRAFLTLSSEEPAAFDDRDREPATDFARWAAPAAGQGWRQLDALAAGEPTFGAGRLGTALGIVMARYRVGSAEALDMLYQASEALRWSLLSMAAEVVHSGRLPARDIHDARLRNRSATDGDGLALLPASQWMA